MHLTEGVSLDGVLGGVYADGVMLEAASYIRANDYDTPLDGVQIIPWQTILKRASVTAALCGRSSTSNAQSAWKQGESLSLGVANATYDRLYRTQPWVYTCVNKLARAIARLPIKTYSLSMADGERE